MDTQNTTSNKEEINYAPPQLLFQMKMEAFKLSKRHPNWKPEKLARKVAQKFNIKVIDGEGNKLDPAKGARRDTAI